MTLAEAAEYFERAAQCYEKASQSWQQSATVTYREEVASRGVGFQCMSAAISIPRTTGSPCRKKGEAEKSTEIELSLTIFGQFLGHVW